MNALSPEQAGGVEREQVNRAMAPEMARAKRHRCGNEPTGRSLD